MNEDIFNPPRTGVELLRVWTEHLKPNKEYFDKIMKFAETFKEQKWYFFREYVKEENMTLFKYCFCYMIAVYKMPYEFKDDYSAIRRIQPVIISCRLAVVPFLETPKPEKSGGKKQK